jgi:DNA invertase Pin-like site-specific DNA recombinase
MALVGYARVSSVGQSLEVQRDKLKHCLEPEVTRHYQPAQAEADN